ncbi:hypothetical protein [Coxiella endosymbiont of Ornithodoros maritimus]|uniref:hypothetical protein n=1 Tax=Coxiella endosymbiont of Ornithodoros maritimus TaxID=1656172 RepID=UPI0022653F78|nr:hypothetical protein [Coxiella endosymbiont of Ornithodoros maritimus]
MQEQMRLNATQADLITGVYFDYNVALHMLVGYVGGRFLSYRVLVIVGLFFSSLLSSSRSWRSSEFVLGLGLHVN